MGDRLYSETHEWVTLEGTQATVGVTDFAQAQLGDVVFLELPEPGRKLEAGEAFGAIESVKAASDLFSPVRGTVAEVNSVLADAPEVVNRDPLGEGWIIKIELAADPPPGLLDESAYAKMTEGGHL